MNKKFLPLIDSLNGRKILVPGNHDIWEAKELLKYFDDINIHPIFNTKHNIKTAKI